MTEISQSHGNLNSVNDESSTPSNHSEYFSVTSSLDILNCNDEVYYSMDEEIEKEGNSKSNSDRLKSFQCQKMLREDHIDLDEIIENMFLNSEFEGPFKPENDVGIDDWDEVCDNLNSLISQESVSSDEEDLNPSSVLSDSATNHCSLEIHNSDNELNTSLSLNNLNLMTNSVIEGELSELNDIVYESSTSQDPCIIDDDDESLKKDDEEESIVELAILEMVRNIEFVEMQEDEKHNYKEEINEEIRAVDSIEQEVLCGEVQEQNNVNNSSYLISDEVKSSIIKDSSKSYPIESIEDSPIKTSSLCCSIRRKKIPSSKSKLQARPSKSKSVFSFFKFYKKERCELKSPISMPQLNIITASEDLFSPEGEVEEYVGIPFIDADVGVYSDWYIPLAKQEIYCE